MEPVSFDDAETYEPEDGWWRVSMTGSDAVSFEWFEKPPGHSSLMHNPENDQSAPVWRGNSPSTPRARK
jgi:hypothetical protein